MPDLRAPIRREASSLLRYSRSRRHFTLNLVLDALLSIALVLAAFQIMSAPARHSATSQLRISGALAMSGTELVKFIRQEHLVAYWVGLNSADKYTVVATSPGEVTISYFPKSADISKLDNSKLVVQTREPLSADQARAFSEDVSGGGTFLMSQGPDGNAIHYNPATPNKVTVTFKKPSAAVTIFDSTPGTPLALAMKSGAIQKIS